MKSAFCVRLKRGKHVIAVANLAKQGFEVFLPLKQTTVLRNRRFVKISQPLIPFFCFVWFDRETDNWGVIKNTRGCIGVLMNGTGEDAKPSPIRESIITALRERNDDPAAIAPLGFSPGDSITIKVGPFADMEAVFVGESAGTATVIVTMFGRPFQQDIPLRDLAGRVKSLDTAVA